MMVKDKPISSITENRIKVLEPILGRALIEAIKEDVGDYLKEQAGIDTQSSLIYIPETSNKRVPLYRGRILKTAPDWGGKVFKERNGSDVGYIPQIGDIVYFVPNETYAVDPDRKFHLLNDCDIVGYEKNSKSGE